MCTKTTFRWRNRTEFKNTFIAQLVVGGEKKASKNAVRVPCVPLYSILLALGNPMVDLLSIDLEGWELKVRVGR